MKKLSRSLAVLLAVLTVLLPTAGITGMAAGGITLRASKTAAAVSEELTVTVTVSADESMYGVEAHVGFASNVLRFVSGDSAASEGSDQVKIVGTPAGQTTASYTLRFTAVGAGTCPITVSGSYVGDDEISITGAPIQVTVAAPTTSGNTSSTNSAQEPSDNANLASLRVSGGTLSPRFSANTTSYRVEVANSVTRTTIYASAADSGAKVEGAGNIDLEVGSNKRTVTVTAARGNQKQYTLDIVRLTEDETPPEDGEDTPAVDIWAAEVDGRSCHVQQDISDQTVPSGFEPSTAYYNGEEVGVLRDAQNDYVLYILQDDAEGTKDYYLYREDRDEFVKLPYVLYAGLMYIFADLDEAISAPDGYRLVSANIGGNAVRAFTSDDEALADFYILYCYIGGKYGFYSYDYVEGTLQRAPTFVPVMDDDDRTAVSALSSGLLKNFANMSTSGRLVILTLAAIILCAIALAVMLIVYLVNHRRPEPVAVFKRYSEEPFDQVKVTDPFEFDGEVGQRTDEQPDDSPEEPAAEPPVPDAAEDQTETDE